MCRWFHMDFNILVPGIYGLHVKPWPLIGFTSMIRISRHRHKYEYIFNGHYAQICFFKWWINWKNPNILSKFILTHYQLQIRDLLCVCIKRFKMMNRSFTAEGIKWGKNSLMGSFTSKYWQKEDKGSQWQYISEAISEGVGRHMMMYSTAAVKKQWAGSLGERSAHGLDLTTCTHSESRTTQPHTGQLGEAGYT